MTSIIRVEVFSGAMDEGPLCYLLQVDEFHFLLDCGWDEHFDIQYINALKKRIPQIDAVLLSYADPGHLGALPYLVGKCGLNCPVYATVPVYKMGQMFMYDWFQSHQNVEDFTTFSLDDVDAAFDKIQQLKYSQNVGLKGRGHGLQITPFPAGHMIGGTFWRILKSGEEEIVYAVDFNHKKERHLNGCTFDGISRPNLLITDSYNAKYQQARRKQRDEQLLTLILQTVRGGGNVLVVIDTAGRVLELAQLLDQLWHNAEAGLITYSLILLNNVAYNVVEFAKSQVEWMSDKVLRSFEEGRYNPFQFRHLQICHSMNELRKVRAPMVALSSGPDMEAGFARELFIEWSANPKNSIILTSRSSPGTLARKLVETVNASSRQLTIEVRKRVRLEGSELDEYWRAKKQKEQEAARQRLEEKRRLSRQEAEDSGQSSEEEGDKTEYLHPYDVMLRFEHQQKTSYFKQAHKQYPMYPFVDEKIKYDEYGVVIRPEDYIVMEQSSLGADFGAKKDDDDADGHTFLMPGSIVNADLPTKCIRYVQKIDVVAKLAFIDFEGRSDGDSIRRLMTQMKPKQVVIIHGTAENTHYLADHCRSVKGIDRVFAPRVGELVDATIESHIFQVTLTDVLMSSLDFQSVKDAELSWVDARMTVRRGPAQLPTASHGQLKALAPGLEEETDSESGTPCLDMLPAADLPAHTAVFVNDPKLSDLKQSLMLNGLQAEFSAGVLYVNNVIAIRRNEAGKFHIEGTTCEDYYRIRDFLYKQFAIV